MLGIGNFIRRYSDPLQAQRDLMEHYAYRRKNLAQWDRRYSHMRFVLRWAPLFRRHILAVQRQKSTPPKKDDQLAA